MTPRLWEALAALALGATVYLATIVAQPGSQVFAAVGMGACALFTIRWTLAAARLQALLDYREIMQRVAAEYEERQR